MSTRCLPGELRRPACVFAGVHIRHLFYSGREASPARLQVILSNTKPCPCSATVCWHFGSPLVGVGCSSKKSPGPQKSVTGQRKQVGFSTIRTHLQVTCSVFHSAKLTAERGCGSAATGLLQGLAQNLHWLR